MIFFSVQIKYEMVEMPVMSELYKTDYEFVEMHFHWAENSDAGSEHLINNQS